MKSNKLFNKKALTISGIFFAIGLLLILWGVIRVINVNNTKEEPVSYYSVKSKKEKGKKVYLDIVAIQQFGKMSDESNYYYVAFDNNPYPYIVKLKKSTYNKILEDFNKGLEDDEEYQGYRVEGWIDDLEYEMYNIFKNQVLNDEIEYLEDLEGLNFSLYFDYLYFNEVKNPNVSDALVPAYGGFTLSLIFGIWFIGLLLTRRRIKKQMELYPDALTELENGLNKEYGKTKIYLTDKYIITKDNIIPISEIKDVYKIDYRYNGIKTAEILGLKTTSDQEIRMGMIQKKDYDNLTELVSDISKKIKKK